MLQSESQRLRRRRISLSVPVDDADDAVQNVALYAWCSVANLHSVEAHPVMSAQGIDAATQGTSTSQAYLVIDRLVDVGPLDEMTGRKKGRVWAATDVIAELDRRIQVAMTTER